MKTNCTKIEPPLVETALSMLTEKRLIHTQGVLKMAAKLAEHYGADWNKLELAVACHDLFRGKYGDELNSLVKEYGLPEKYMDNPNLAHGKIAAAFVEKEWGVDDPDILNSISFHTTGRRNMSLQEKIVFLADAIEEGRDYPGVEVIREEAFNDLDRGVLLSLKNTYRHLSENGVPEDQIDKDSLDAIHWLEETINNHKS